MNCFKHENNTACGVCAFCHRGVCKDKECAVETEGYIFCSDHDENDMRAKIMKDFEMLRKLEEKNKNG
jgi:hypothetical protein